MCVGATPARAVSLADASRHPSAQTRGSGSASSPACRSPRAPGSSHLAVRWTRRAAGLLGLCLQPLHQLAEGLACLLADRPPVREAGDLELKGGQLLEAAPALCCVFIERAESRSQHVRGSIADEQHAALSWQQQGQMAGGMARRMDGAQTVEGQHLTVAHLVGDGDWLALGRRQAGSWRVRRGGLPRLRPRSRRRP